MQLQDARRRALIMAVVLGVGGIGLSLLQAGNAATYATSAETETGTLRGSASIIADNNASNGKAVRFGLPVTEAACSVSGAIGATAPKVYPVASPVNGDNTSVIQSKINSASATGGGIVTLQSGTYTVDGHLIMKSNVALKGAGMFATIIKAGPNFMSASDGGGYPVVTTDGASNVTIENLEADQNAVSLFQAKSVNNNTPGRLTAYLLDVVSSKNVIVQHVATRDPFTYSLVANGSSSFCFRYNNVAQNPAANGDFDQLDGIHILDSSFGDVIDNYVDQRYGGATDGDDGLVAHTLQGGTTHDITYEGNVVRGGSNGDDMQIAPGGEIYNVKILNNEFYGGPFGIRTGIYGPGTNNIANVSITGNNIHNDLPGNAYASGGEAIDIGGVEAGGGLSSATNIVVKNNEACSASDNGQDGPFYVVPGNGNVKSSNTTYANCADAAGSNPATS